MLVLLLLQPEAWVQGPRDVVVVALIPPPGHRLTVLLLFISNTVDSGLEVLDPKDDASPEGKCLCATEMHPLPQVVEGHTSWPRMGAPPG